MSQTMRKAAKKSLDLMRTGQEKKSQREAAQGDFFRSLSSINFDNTTESAAEGECCIANKITLHLRTSTQLHLPHFTISKHYLLVLKII